MVFWEARKRASILRHRGDNVNTVYTDLLRNFLRNEYVLNIEQYMELSSWFILCSWQHFVNQVQVVQKLDGAIHRINLCPLDNAIGFPNAYPLDSDLFGG